MSISRGGSTAMAKESKLEKIVCDLKCIDVVLYHEPNARGGMFTRAVVVQPCNKEFDVGEPIYCDIKQYLKCRKIYKEYLPKE